MGDVVMRQGDVSNDKLYIVIATIPQDSKKCSARQTSLIPSKLFGSHLLDFGSVVPSSVQPFQLVRSKFGAHQSDSFKRLITIQILTGGVCIVVRKDTNVFAKQKSELSSTPFSS